jgi:phosphoenolpyruvate carboxykinase (ATP)
VSIFTDPVQAQSILRGLSPDALRELARSSEIPNSRGIAVYQTRIRSRSAKHTFVVYEPKPEHEERLRRVREYLRKQALVLVERDIVQNPGGRFRTHYYVPKAYAQLAHMLSRNMFVPEQDADPDIVTVQVPDWPELYIYVHPTSDGKVYTWVLGTDYYGECKMGSLRAAMHIMREHRRGLGLHAGSKILRIRESGTLVDKGVLIFGLSGTGKTTITVNDHGLKAPEQVVVLQDDINLLRHDGFAYGTEESFYVKTDAINNQPEIEPATHLPDAIGENVYVDPNTHEIDFANWEISTNGRAIIPRRAIANTEDSIDLPRVDVIFFNMRRYDVPPVGRLTSAAQAAAFFMLGESTITSADDPTRVGEPLRVVAFDPFVLDEYHKQGNVFYEILKANPHIQVYLVNTGKVGGMDDGVKITPEVTLKVVESVVRGHATWKPDENLQYETAVDIDGVDLTPFDPDQIYGPERYARMMKRLRTERRAWLQQFPKLQSDILAAV